MTRRPPGPPDPPDQEPEPVVWKVEDPNATWWDDVWPFRDDREDLGQDLEVDEPADDPTDESPLEPATTPSATPASGSEGGDQAEPLPAPWAAARYARSPSWWRRPVTWSAAVGLVAGIAIGVVWARSGGTAEDRASLTLSPTYESPVALPPGTSFVRTQVLASGGIRVTHWIHTARAVSSLTLRVPQTLGLDPAAVTVSGLTVAADGMAEPPASPGSWTGDALHTVAVPAARDLYVSYRLTGAVQSAGSNGRALARITALVVDAGGATTTTRQSVVGAKVLALACSNGPPGALPAPCGTTRHGRWSVLLDGRRQHSRVMAQVDLR
ncbi:MAG: hypothetical protein QM747_21195 [Nocardioides sp.]